MDAHHKGHFSNQIVYHRINPTNICRYMYNSHSPTNKYMLYSSSSSQRSYNFSLVVVGIGRGESTEIGKRLHLRWLTIVVSHLLLSRELSHRRLHLLVISSHWIRRPSIHHVLPLLKQLSLNSLGKSEEWILPPSPSLLSASSSLSNLSNARNGEHQSESSEEMDNENPEEIDVSSWSGRRQGGFFYSSHNGVECRKQFFKIFSWWTAFFYEV